MERANQLDPKNNDIKLYLGVLYARQKKYQKAIDEVKAVTSAAPNDQQAHLILCRIYLLADDRNAALGMYQSFKAVNEPLAEEMYKWIFSNQVISAGGLIGR